jgi:hypothetical protein
LEFLHEPRPDPDGIPVPDQPEGASSSRSLTGRGGRFQKHRNRFDVAGTIDETSTPSILHLLDVPAIDIRPPACRLAQPAEFCATEIPALDVDQCHPLRAAYS